MAIPHLRARRDPVTDFIHAIDVLNGGMFELQRRIKEGGCSGAEALEIWHQLRDQIDRKVLSLVPVEALRSPTERAYAVLADFLGAMLATWDLNTSQRTRLELALGRAERERVGAIAAAA